jgi:hypothetical protein
VAIFREVLGKRDKVKRRLKKERQWNMGPAG